MNEPVTDEEPPVVLDVPETETEEPPVTDPRLGGDESGFPQS